MVENSKGMISPSLAMKLRDYSIANDVAISKPVILSAVNYLKNHTDLSQLDIDRLIEMSVKSVHKKTPNSNYDGTEELDPKSFGKEVILVCTENGIKIKRVPKDVEEEIEDKFENMDGDVLDSTYTILNMQPDLCPEDRGKVIVSSLLDTLNDKESFDGQMNYEAFGRNVKKNLDSLRKEKSKEEAVDKLVDMFINVDNYEDSFLDAFMYFDEIHEFKEEDFSGYLGGIFSEFDGGSDYLFKKLRNKIETKIQARPAKRQAKKQARSVKHDANKQRRKEKGSRIANILTGGAVGMGKMAEQKLKDKLSAKKNAKKSVADVNTAINTTAISAAPVSPALAAAANSLNTPPPTTPPTPSDSGSGGGGSGSGGGGGDDGSGSQPEDNGGGATLDQDSDTDHEEVYDGDQNSIGDRIDEAQEEAQDTEQDMQSDVDADQEDASEDDTQGSYIGTIKRKDGWYPEHENNPEIAKFFGYMKKSEVREHKPLSVLLGADSFIGSENADNDTWKIIGAVVVIAVAIFVYFKYIK